MDSTRVYRLAAADGSLLVTGLGPRNVTVQLDRPHDGSSVDDWIKRLDEHVRMLRSLIDRREPTPTGISFVAGEDIRAGAEVQVDETTGRLVPRRQPPTVPSVAFGGVPGTDVEVVSPTHVRVTRPR